MSCAVFLEEIDAVRPGCVPDIPVRAHKSFQVNLRMNVPINDKGFIYISHNIEIWRIVVESKRQSRAHGVEGHHE